jgi:adenosylcobinamide kinase/adenosylcobinamide-phosphate guanylyltransferase
MFITFVTGGQRSGKSSYAVRAAEGISPNPVYLATARHWDDDFTQRIRRHQADRGPQWETLEVEKQIGFVTLQKRVVVLDCITLWLTNLFHDNHYDVELTLKEAKKEWALFMETDNRVFVVSNELGMGIHAQDAVSRQFTDLQGWMNQHIARCAQEVVLMVSGIAVKIK